MKHLQALKNQVELLRTKATIYQNELYDAHRVSELNAEIAKLDGMILRLMTLEQQIRVHNAKIA